MRKEDYSYDKSKSKGVLFFSASSVGDTKQLIEFGIREILVSYFYMRKSLKYYAETIPFIKKENGLFMTDSGAFSFMGKFKEGTKEYEDSHKEEFWLPYLEEYVEWLWKNKDNIYVAANLDLDVVVGRDVVRKWNKKYFEPLEKAGLQIVYVAHEDPSVGDPHAIEHFKEYCMKYKYVGINQRHKDYASRFYQIAKHHNVRVHGFAWTELRLCKTYPFFSNDSSVGGDSMVLVRDSSGVTQHIKIGKLFKMLKVTEEFGMEKRCSLEGWRTLTLDECNKVIWADMTSVIQHSVTKQMYRLNIEGGISLEVTEDHSLIQLDKNGVSVEVSAKDLKEGDFVLLTKKIPFSRVPSDIDDTFLEFLGLWVGDGSFCKSSNVIGMSCYNTIETRRIIDEIAFRFGAKVTPSKNDVDCYITNKRLRETLRYLGFKGNSHTKRIPDFIFGLTKYQIGSFLRGYFSADGTGNGLGCSTVSKGLLHDLRMLLNGMGILTSVTTHKKGTFVKDGKVYRKRPSYSISIRDTQSRQLFMDNIGFCIAYKHNALFLDILNMKGKEQVWAKRFGVPVELSKTGRVSFKRDTPLVASLKKTQKRINRERNERHFNKTLLDNDIWYVQIKKIETLPIEEVLVYDLEVPGYEKFIANGVVVHNTTWLGGVRYGTTYDYDGKNFRTLDYKKKHLRKAHRIKYENHADISLKDVTLKEDRVSINKMNLLGWLGFRREYVKMANLKLHSKNVIEYERKH